MPHTELEAKLAVDNLDELQVTLNVLGAEPIGRWLQTDRFFDFPDQRLKHADSALRLREHSDLADGKCHWSLTFKGPQKPGRYKKRTEIEFSVDRPQAAQAILEALGLEQFISYTKRRSSFRRHDCRIELDQLEDIGTFIEVEGPDHATITDVLAELGLADRAVISKSYLAMIIERRAGNV